MTPPTLDISFLVPTLNRGDYVVRAVQSCLDALDHADATGEIVVLDSESDDGSWETLQQRFGNDPSVRLKQNRRGLGPLKSWLDAAEGLSGSTVTFVWSDDYITPGFVSALLPLVHNGSPLAVGTGTIRDADCAEPLPAVGARADQHRDNLIAAYLGVLDPGALQPPVSPTCALFARDSFEHWRGLVGAMSTATELRRQFMWRRAIGPDLLLYLIALADADLPIVPAFDGSVAQFSHHADSITVSSPIWNLTVGYWLARVAFLVDPALAGRLAAADRRRIYGQALVQGWLLRRNMPATVSGFADRAAAVIALDAEIALLQAASRQWLGGMAHAAAIAGALARRGRRTLGGLLTRKAAERSAG